MAKKKYDTNPLDPEFPERAKKAADTSPVDPATNEFPPPSVTEEQTRRFDEVNFNSYQDSFSGRDVPQNYRNARAYGDMNRSSSRKVDKIGLPENITTALPYVPFSIGLVAGLIILFLAPRSESKVRFHAAQGLAAHVAILIISAILSGLGNIAGAANVVFQIVTTVMLVIFTIKAWRGKPVHIESVDDLTEWLEEKIAPKK